MALARPSVKFVKWRLNITTDAVKDISSERAISTCKSSITLTKRVFKSEGRISSVSFPDNAKWNYELNFQWHWWLLDLWDGHGPRYVHPKCTVLLNSCCEKINFDSGVHTACKLHQPSRLVEQQEFYSRKECSPGMSSVKKSMAEMRIIHTVHVHAITRWHRHFATRTVVTEIVNHLSIATTRRKKKRRMLFLQGLLFWQCWCDLIYCKINLCLCCQLQKWDRRIDRESFLRRHS